MFSLWRVLVPIGRDQWYLGAIQVLHNPPRRGPSNAYISLGGGAAKILHAYKGGGVRQMLTHIKCYTPVHMSAHGNACALKVVKS